MLAVIASAGALGCLWGWWRPQVEFVRGDDGQLGVDPADTAAGFSGFAEFVVITCAAAGLAGVVTYKTARGTRGLAMLFWLSATVAGGAIVCGMAGDVVAGLLSDPPGRVPMPVNLGPVPVLAAAFCAAVTYYSALAADAWAGEPTVETKEVTA